MPKNRLSDLRNHLFATLESLQDTENPMPVDRAKAVSEISRDIISSAKVELEFMRLIDSADSTFFDSPKQLIEGTPQSKRLH